MKSKFIYLILLFMIVGCSNSNFETGTIERKFVIGYANNATDDEVAKVCKTPAVDTSTPNKIAHPT